MLGTIVPNVRNYLEKKYDLELHKFILQIKKTHLKIHTFLICLYLFSGGESAKSNHLTIFPALHFWGIDKRAWFDS